MSARALMDPVTFIVASDRDKLLCSALGQLPFDLARAIFKQQQMPGFSLHLPEH